MPLGVDQGVGTIVWSPLGWGRLTGKLRRGQPVPEDTRLKNIPDTGPKVSNEYLYDVVDALDEVAKETGKTIPQVALNWLLQRPTISSLIFGARNEAQLLENLGSVGWSLNEEQMNKLNAASKQRPVYPYWHQRDNLKLNPVPVL
jgi:aryl-alcohol dehydrogenase-like predicted oxidoreductase